MKIAVLLSGGVDSTVAALLLKEKGYDVAGLTMLNWDQGVVEKAAEAARFLGIEHKVVDLRGVFEKRVIDYFCCAYERGETPNPCVECNRSIKFGIILDIARDTGFDMVATGHYAQIEFDSNRKRYLLKKGSDISKDQSYFLYVLNQEQLSRTLFPLGKMTKKQVMEIAREKGMKVIEERESQEICFIADDYREFLKKKISYKEGEVRDLQGNVLGTHHGLPFYTIGQRKGLGISAGRPVYVIDMDFHNNQLIVDDEENLYKDSLTSMNNNFIYTEQRKSPLRVEAKIRYKARPAKATIYFDEDTVRVKFNKPQRAITRGQSIVYYLCDYVFGGGIIM